MVKKEGKPKVVKSESMKDNPEFKARIAKLKKEKSEKELLYLAEKPASMVDILDRLAARKALDELGVEYSLANV